MEKTDLVYDVNEKPVKVKEWILYTLQYVFAVLPATILISSICGTSIAAGLISAGLGTLVFLCITRFRVPMCTSNSGATVSGIVGCFALSNVVEEQFTGVVIGGCIMALIYGIASIFVKKFGTNWLYKLMPPVVSGTTIVIIGATLSFFIPTYAQLNGEYSLLAICIAFVVMIVTALTANYGKGIFKTIPFLTGLVFGYILCMVLTLLGVENLVDFSILEYHGLINVPDLAFLHVDFIHFDWSHLPQILLMFGLVSIAAMVEHVADVQAAGEVIGKDLTKELHRTLLGDGLSSLAGSLTGAQMTTTYSEYTGTMAVSRVASSRVTLSTAITLICLGFLSPFNQFLSALPNCVFAGVAICAYGLIAATGLQTLLKAKIDFASSKNRFIIACMISCGISGLVINIGGFSISQIVLAMVVGIVLNIILKEE